MTASSTRLSTRLLGAAAVPAAGDAGPAAPVRIVHLGLGNFFRAHQAWYTDQAPDARRVGDRRVHRPVGRARRQR